MRFLLARLLIQQQKLLQMQGFAKLLMQNSTELLTQQPKLLQMQGFAKLLMQNFTELLTQQ
ncbi:hypothetical protein [uncultured virus]|uniref:Uncharacterized protein n=1 Tax=uncultured virus TaxID=340016 RepID=A0A5Q0TWV4_9VIRU|nr:hypothetical protein [uncultured virus]